MSCELKYSSLIGRGSKVFSTFIGFLKSKDPNDRTEQALLNELILFNDYIKENVIVFAYPLICFDLQKISSEFL